MDLKETLGEELYNQVTEKLGDKKILVNDGSFIPKSRLDEVISQKKTYETKLEEVNSKLTEFEGLAKDNDVLKGKINDLTESNKKVKEEADKQVQQMKFNTALDIAISSVKGKDVKPEAIKALLNLSEVKLDGDKLLNFDSQIESLKESDKYLFDNSTPSDSDKSKSFTKRKIEGFITKEAAMKMTHEEKVANIKKINESQPYWE